MTTKGSQATATEQQRSCADVEDNYHTQLDALLVKIDGLEAEVEEEDGGGNQATRAVRTALVKHLTNLLARKGKIEKEILEHTAELAAAYYRVRSEVKDAMDARAAALDGAVCGLDGLMKDGMAQEQQDDEVRREGDVQMALDGAVEGSIGKGIKRKRSEDGNEVQQGREERKR